MDIINASLKELSDALNSKKISSVELTKHYLERIAKFDGTVKSYLHVATEQAIKDAEAQDAAIAKGEKTVGGIPVALKDILVTKDMPTTCASKMLDNFYSPYDAAVVRKMKAAGYIMLGKLNMDQMAMGSTGESSYFQKTVNPWDESKVPGGSSSGSAAAMAARLAPITLGSDTGGSIRQPAGFCGVVGFKPTYGTVSRQGAVAYASSLDQIGPIAKSVEDVAFIMDTISEYDEMDPMCVKDINRNFSKNLAPSIKGLKIGLPKDYLTSDVAPAVSKAVLEAIEVFKSQGAELVELDMPHTKLGLAVYQTIANAEVGSNLAKFDGIEFGYRAEAKDLNDVYTKSRGEAFGAEVKKRVMLGIYLLQSSQYKEFYQHATKVRALIRQDFDNAFKKCDLIIGPTSSTTAFGFGDNTRTPVEMYLNDLYTVSLNLNGSCGISIPCGLDSAGLPIGLQLQGNMFADQLLLNAAYGFQKVTSWHSATPKLIG